MSSKTNKDKTVSIRLSQSMLEALDARAGIDDKDRTQVIRNAIEKYLDLPEESVEDKLETLEKQNSSLEKQIEALDKELKSEVKRNDSIEVQIEELRRIITAFVEKAK